MSSNVEQLDLLIQIVSATGLPIKVSDTEKESCFIQLTAFSDIDENTTQEADSSGVNPIPREQTARSILLSKQDIHLCGLKGKFNILVSELSSIKILNDILHQKKQLVRLDIVKATSAEDPVVSDAIVASTTLDLSPLLHSSRFEKEIQIENVTQDTSAKGKKPPVKGKGVVSEEIPLPTHTTLTYTVELVGREKICPPKSNFMSLRVDSISNLPQAWIQSFQDPSVSSEKKAELLTNHLFTYNVLFSAPCVVNGALDEISFGITGGKLQTEDETYEKIFIAFPNPVSFFLDAESVKHYENMVFNKEGFPITFSRSLNPKVVKDPTWEDHNKEKYTAKITLSEESKGGLSVFLEPGKKEHCFSSLNLDAIPPVVDTTQDDKKKPAKPAAVKLPKDLPAELAPEPLKEGEPHPFESSGTTISLTITFDLPIIPLAQDRLGSNLKLEDLIQKRERIIKKIPAVDTFKSQLEKVVAQLVQQYKESQKDLKTDVSSREKFIFDLNNSGMFFTIKDLLKEAVKSIVQERFASQKNNDPKQLQQFYNMVYVFLMDHVHEVLNRLYNNEESTSSTEENEEKKSEKLQSDLKRWALESEFEREYGLSEEFYQKRINLLPNDVDLWYEFGQFSLRTLDEGNAEYCFRQALGLDITHTQSLLDYSLLLIHQEKYYESQSLLNALIETDGENVRAWVALHLLYELMDLMEDSHYALNYAKQLIVSRSGSVNARDLYFDLTHYLLYTLQLDSIAEPLLQKLQAEANGTEVNVLYGKMYLLRQDYERSEEKLKQVLEKQNNNIQAWNLLGDVHFEQNHKQEAKQAFEICISIAADGELHDAKVFMKLGQIYLDLKNHEGAKAMYLRACDLWYCSLTLLGLGVSYFACEEYDLAEQALNEANILDNRNVHVWAWLTLVNVKQNQLANAALCKLQVDRSSRQIKDQRLQRIFSQVKSIQNPEACVNALKPILDSFN